jgi:DNA primase
MAPRMRCVELHALLAVEARHRVVQSDHADLDQVVDLDIGRQLGNHLVRETAHERTVLLEHRIGIELALGGVHGDLQNLVQADR